ncbi:MAG: carboxypeptidase-like regulatory domain-containing protein [Actinobacteria bacterium]|nr:carboxypeptidase-like regulatory domain-containing protein [Actinomycetota bacterium]
MSATQEALDGLVTILTAASGTAGLQLARPGRPHDGPRPAVLVTPLSLDRVGRSRRAGALLDLELRVAVETSGDDVLGLTEALLLAAESVTHTRLESLPQDRPGFGFLIGLPVSVAVPEPTAPPVEQVVVDLQPLVALTGTVVDPDGAAVPGAEVSSGLTRQRVTTDAAGAFSLPGLSRPTTLTVSRGARRATVEVPASPTGLRLVLPNHEGG